MRRLRWPAASALLIAAAIFLNNSNLFAPPSSGAPVLLAHRGIAQRFDTRGLENDTCTAARMLPPTHGYLENTIASMRASFAADADVVELDIHPTTDGRFAVFHDWTLDCRTNGHGVTREHSLAELKALDIGYGYTADGGRTFPFRGRGIGLMPSLDEVLAALPDRRLLINIKSNDTAEGEMLAGVLSRLPPERRARLMVYGGERPIAALRRLRPEVQAMSRATLKACLARYVAFGWTGLVPAACRNTIVYAPINLAPWLWGWPDRFLSRMARAGSSVFVIGPYRGGDFSSGLDTPEAIARLPRGYSGGVMTDEIGTVAPLLKGGSHSSP